MNGTLALLAVAIHHQRIALNQQAASASTLAPLIYTIAVS
jgi:hypothetical protein